MLNPSIENETCAAQLQIYHDMMAIHLSRGDYQSGMQTGMLMVTLWELQRSTAQVVESVCRRTTNHPRFRVEEKKVITESKPKKIPFAVCHKPCREKVMAIQKTITDSADYYEHTIGIIKLLQIVFILIYCEHLQTFILAFHIIHLFLYVQKQVGKCVNLYIPATFKQEQVVAGCWQYHAPGRPFFSMTGSRSELMLLGMELNIEYFFNQKLQKIYMKLGFRNQS